MPNTELFSLAAKNQLLARLPRADYGRLSAHLRPHAFEVKQVVYEARAQIEYVYFPTRGSLSALTILKDGRAIEVATIGNEGMVGLPAFNGEGVSVNEILVQVRGDGLRLPADLLRREGARQGALRRILLRYHTAFMGQVSQSVACNGLHAIQPRCCRWLLMTHDRMGTDEFALTH